MSARLGQRAVQIEEALDLPYPRRPRVCPPELQIRRIPSTNQVHMRLKGDRASFGLRVPRGTKGNAELVNRSDLMRKARVQACLTDFQERLESGVAHFKEVLETARVYLGNAGKIPRYRRTILGEPTATKRTPITRHLLTRPMRQSIYGRLAGYEDVNDSDRLSLDSAACSTSIMSSVSTPAMAIAGPYPSSSATSRLSTRNRQARQLRPQHRTAYPLRGASKRQHV